MTLSDGMESETKLKLHKARRLISGSLKIEVTWPAIGGLALRVALDRGYDVVARFGEVAVPRFFDVVDTGEWERVGVDAVAAVGWIEAIDNNNAVYLELLGAPPT